jgi:hypothetical protein
MSNWFASTTPAANEDRTPDESVMVAGKHRHFVAAVANVAGHSSRGPGQTREVAGLLKVFDNGPDRTTYQNAVGRFGGQEVMSLTISSNKHRQQSFPYTHGLDPGTTKAQVRRCLERNKGDNGTADLEPIA